MAVFLYKSKENWIFKALVEVHRRASGSTRFGNENGNEINKKEPRRSGAIFID